MWNLMSKFFSIRKLVKVCALLLIAIVLLVNWQILSRWETPLSYFLCLILDILTVTFSVFMIHFADIKERKEEKIKCVSFTLEDLKLKKLMQSSKGN